NPLFSAASNLGPNNPAQIQLIKERQKAIAAFDHVSVPQIPADAVTASASGLNPGISPQNAAIQVNRVAAARNLPVSTVKALVAKYTQGRTLGFLGEPAVDVLELNIALDQLSAKSTGSGPDGVHHRSAPAGPSPAGAQGRKLEDNPARPRHLL